MFVSALTKSGSCGWLDAGVFSMCQVVAYISLYLLMSTTLLLLSTSHYSYDA